MFELYALLLFMIAAAIIAVQIKDLLSSVIAVGAVGLGLSVVFLILKAPDLAITQLVVELLCVIILIRAVVKRETTTTEDTYGFLTVIAGLIFVGVFLFFVHPALKELPNFGEPLMRVAKNFIEVGQAKTGASNLVASVILDFRAYDTLGEATVLFTAVIGVLVVLRRTGRKRKDEVIKDDE